MYEEGRDSYGRWYNEQVKVIDGKKYDFTSYVRMVKEVRATTGCSLRAAKEIADDAIKEGLVTCEGR